MVSQVMCLALVRGKKGDLVKFCEEMGFEKEYIEKDTNHYRMVCTGYFPCDMIIDFSFEDLSAEFSVDIAYLFSEFDDQLCEYDEVYNLKEFLRFNRISASGIAYGFEEETGAVDDLEILKDFLCKSEQNVTTTSEENSWTEAFEALVKYDDQLIREGKFMDQVSVSGFEAALAGFPRIRLAAEAGDEQAKTLLDNYDNAEL